MTPEERLYRGSRAKEIIESDAFQEAFSAIEAAVIDQWKTSPARDESGRQNLWQYLRLLEKVKLNLQTTMETGRLAQLDLNHKATLKDRLRAVIG